ncbi:MAG: glycosyltransferase family 4 protein [Acidimicrobiales bacterium]
MTPVSVGINLLWLVPGVVGGSEESTLASLRALSDLAPDDLDLRLFVLEPFAAAHPDVTAAFRTTVLPLSGRSRAARVGGEASWLASRTRRLDLVHHAGGTAPPMRGAPYVLTVHDLQPLEHRATHGRLKRAYLRAILPRSVHAARRIAVPSEFVRQSLLTQLDANPLRVVVIPHGIETNPAPTSIEVLSDRYQLDGPFVLYPAITYPHKNHAVLVDAFAAVVARHPDALLVLTGGEGGEEERVRAQVEGLHLTDRVRRTGRIPAADLAGLYRAASIVAVPSRYEGFGLPAVEALAYGAPLVAAAATALPEVVGEAGELVDPDDVDGWAAAISDLLAAPDERARRAEAGLVQARRYSWAANAAALADLYRGAV